MVETESSSSSSTLVVGPSEPLLVELTAEFRGGGGKGNSSTELTGLMCTTLVLLITLLETHLTLTIVIF